MANPNVEAAYFWVQVGQNATNEKFRVKGSDFKNVAKGPEMVLVQRGNDHYWTWYGQPKDVNSPDFSYRFHYYVTPASETDDGKTAQPSGDGKINLSLYFGSPGPYPVTEWRNVRNESRTINDLDGKEFKTLNNPDLKDGDVCRITHEGGDLEVWYVVDGTASSNNDVWLKFKPLYTKGGDDPDASGYDRDRVDVKRKGSKPAPDGTQVLKFDFYSQANAQPFTQIADTDWVWAQAKDENNDWKHYKVSGKNFKELFVTFQPNFEVTSGTVRLNMKFANTSQTVGVVRAENGYVYNCSGSYTNLSLPVGNYVVPTLEAGGLQCIKLYGTNGNGNFDFKSNFDMSTVTNMKDFVNNCRLFNGNISHFDLSNVTDARYAFQYCYNFNTDIGGGFNMASATNVYRMFYACNTFNHPINQFKFPLVTNVQNVFERCAALNQSIHGIEYMNGAKLYFTFANCQAMNHPLDAEQTPLPPHVVSHYAISQWRGFKQSIAKWTQPLPHKTLGLFNGWNQFNQNVAHLNFSNCTDFTGTFQHTPFNNDSLKNWDFTNSKVRTIAWTFYGCKFNPSNKQVLSNWDTSKITNMAAMFYNCKIGDATNGEFDLSNWNTTNVVNMWAMFAHSRLQKPGFSNWDVSNAKNFTALFRNTVINEDLSAWDVSNVTRFNEMFLEWGTDTSRLVYGEKLEINIDNWDPRSVTNVSNMFYNAGMGMYIAPVNVMAWRMPNMVMNTDDYHGGENQPYYRWNKSYQYDPFISGVPGFGMPIIEPGYEPDLTVHVGSSFQSRLTVKNIDKYVAGDASGEKLADRDQYTGYTEFRLSYPTISEYQIDLFENSEEGTLSFKARTHASDGDNMNWSFVKPYGPHPELMNAPTNMNEMFGLGSRSNQRVKLQNISGLEFLNTSMVTDMSRAYTYQDRNTEGVNNDISKWDVSNVTNMDGMFTCTTAPNFGDLSGWCVKNIPSEPESFAYGADAFTVAPRWGLCPSDPDFVEPEEPGKMPDGDWNNYKWSVLIESSIPQYLGFTDRMTVWKRQKGEGSFSLVGEGYNTYVVPTEEYIVASTRTALSEWVPEDGDINFLAADTSNITNMAYAFDNYSYDFNGTGLEFFDTSNVTNLYKAFNGKSYFNQDLSGWDLRKVSCSYRWDYSTSSWATLNKPRPGYGPR
jgi:surface protein